MRYFSQKEYEYYVECVRDVLLKQYNTTVRDIDVHEAFMDGMTPYDAASLVYGAIKLYESTFNVDNQPTQCQANITFLEKCWYKQCQDPIPKEEL